MRVLIGIIVWIVALLLLTIPLAILFLIKLILIVVPHRCRCRSGNSISDQDDYDVFPLKSGDCIVTSDSSWKRSIVNVGFVLKVGGKVDVDQFREHFANCFNIGAASCECDAAAREESYDAFRSYLINRGGYVFRACAKNLNLSDHIVERSLETGGESDQDTSLEVFIAQWMLQEYEEQKPCWEVVVVPIPSAENFPTTAIAFKVHHGLADGYSLIHIIDRLTGASSPYIVKECQDGFGVQLKQMLEAPLNLGKLAGLPPEKNPFRVHPYSERKYEWMYSFTSFPLEDMKSLRRKNGGVHMVSVIWTVLTGAMRRYLEEEGVEEIPEYIKVGNTLAWPKHPAMSSETKNRDKICNHWVSGIFQVPLREKNPLIRCQQIEQDYLSYHSVGLDKFGKRVVFPILWTMPGSVLQKATSKDLGISGGVTSLIGCESSYSLLTYPVTHVHPILCIHDNAPYIPISYFTFSHGGKLELTIGANPRSIVKDKQHLDRLCNKLCHDELQNFLTITNNA